MAPLWWTSPLLESEVVPWQTAQQRGLMIGATNQLMELLDQMSGSEYHSIRQR